MRAILLVAAFVCGADAERPEVSTLDAWSQARQLADRIDEQLAAGWSAASITPAEEAGDADFLRRAHLDLCGKIPTVWEVREFLADDSPDKRERLIEELIASPAFASFQAAHWRKIILPEASNDITVRFLGVSLEAWLRREWLFERNFREITHDLLTSLPASTEAPPNMGAASPAVFFYAKQGKPELLAAGMARAFLGIRIECAECHDHPFDRWKQKDFWELAAFFGKIENDNEEAGVYASLNDKTGRPELEIPGKSEKVGPKFPDGPAPEITAETSSRAVLADWLASGANPWFAQAAANRVWAQMMGIGLVEPVDDFSASHPASHPELLALLSEELIRHDFDFRPLIRAISLTRAYRLSSRAAGSAVPEPQQFAIAPVKRLTPEQISASFLQATGRPVNAGVPTPDAIDPVNALLETFRETGDRATDSATSIIQALTLINGGLTVEATTPRRGETLTAVIETPGLTRADQIEILFLATLNRFPTPDESQELTQLVDSSSSPPQALADILWALLNSTEFLTNH